MERRACRGARRTPPWEPAGRDPGVYVSLGTGIAAAVTVGGTVIGGAHQAAGEIAYMLVESGPVSAPSSAVAPLEEIVGGKAIGERASQLLGTSLDAAALFARTDPAAAQQVLQHALGVLANAVVNIAVLVDPARVVMGGGVRHSRCSWTAVGSARRS
jgi:glucokinase